MSYDIHIALSLRNAQVLDCLTYVLGFARKDVVIVQDNESLVAHTPDHIFCVTCQRSGEFPITLEILSGEQIEKTLSENELASRIAKFLQADCLIADDSLNPHAWLLVSAGGTVEPVFVDSEALDRDELRIARPRPG